MSRRSLVIVSSLIGAVLVVGLIHSASRSAGTDRVAPIAAAGSAAPSARAASPAATLHAAPSGRERRSVPLAWVGFRDKGVESEARRRELMQALEREFDPRALARRRARRTHPRLFDERDLPVVERYHEEVAPTRAELMVASRWLNGVVVRATAEQLERIAALPSVLDVTEPHLPDPTGPFADRREASQQIDRRRLDGAAGFYGRSASQLRQLGLDRLHDAGFTGEDVIIAVIDTGFDLDHRAFTHPDHPIRVRAQWDFIDNDPVTATEPEDPPFHNLHGTYVLGTLAAYLPGELVGGAPGATYILCKAEYSAEEFPLEEHWFVAALEYAEAHGADLVTSSCVLYTGYTSEQLDGRTSVMAQGWALAVGNGIIGLQGAGNDGHDDDPATSHLMHPADAFGVIAVGAADSTGAAASFSSDGPTADGRTKPEMLACGAGVWTVSLGAPDGFVTASGTSMATPILAGAVACLLQTHPAWTVAELQAALFHSGDYYRRHGRTDPRYVYGYGIPDVYAAAALSGPAGGR